MSAEPTTIEQLLEREKPHTLQEWSFQTIAASYPPDQILMVWGATLMYLGWLDEQEVLACH